MASTTLAQVRKDMAAIYAVAARELRRVALEAGDPVLREQAASRADMAHELRKKCQSKERYR